MNVFRKQYILSVCVCVLVVPSRGLIIIASLQMEECSRLSRGLPASSGQEISGEGGGGGCLCVRVCARVYLHISMCMQTVIHTVGAIELPLTENPPGDQHHAGQRERESN